MKARQIFFFSIFLLSCQIALAQTVNSSITTKIKNGNYNISGIVSSDAVKNEVIEKIKTELSGNADFGKINVQPEVKPFSGDWQTDFAKSLSKIKKWKSGIFIFSDNQISSQPDYPFLPEELGNAQFLLSDGQSFTLKDHKNKVIVLFFLEAWCGPCLQQLAYLDEFYPTISSRKIEIIGIGIETSADEKIGFRELFKKYDSRFNFGWTDEQFLWNFFKLSKMDGIPQSFIILNGRLHGIFKGASPMGMSKLKETIIKTLDENNL